MVLTHLLLKEIISLNRHSILTPTEVEVVVEAKVMAGANLEKVNQIRAIQVAGETSFEAGGVKEVEVQDQIGIRMLQITESVGLVVKKVTCHVTVQREKRVERENKATMHLAEMQMTAEASACLLYATCNEYNDCREFHPR